jgi:hypothetical protein
LLSSLEPVLLSKTKCVYTFDASANMAILISHMNTQINALSDAALSIGDIL